MYGRLLADHAYSRGALLLLVPGPVNFCHHFSGFNRLSLRIRKILSSAKQLFFLILLVLIIC
jgi:hypothetical protein